MDLSIIIVNWNTRDLLCQSIDSLTQTLKKIDTEVAHGRLPGEVAKDEEGMKTMEVLGQNMAWLLKKLYG